MIWQLPDEEYGDDALHSHIWPREKALALQDSDPFAVFGQPVLEYSPIWAEIKRIQARPSGMLMMAGRPSPYFFSDRNFAHANCDLPTSNNSFSAFTFSGGTSSPARN